MSEHNQVIGVCVWREFTCGKQLMCFTFLVDYAKNLLPIADDLLMCFLILEETVTKTTNHWSV